MLSKLTKAILLWVVFFVSGCGSQVVQYTAPAIIEIKDSGPSQPLDVVHIPDALPVKEPRTKAGNISPYTVLGKTYRVLGNTQGFYQSGYASWYGKKFHGKKTSNGEIYNMYGMTAAHKTLPIPSFVRVTNRNNNRSVVVRVNDRGPFHGDRIIDLTYTAARKLGFSGQGTAPVELVIVEPENNNFYQGLDDDLDKSKSTNASLPSKHLAAPRPRNSGGYEIPEGTFLQLGAFSEAPRAQAFKIKIQALSTYPVFIESVVSRGIHRVILGPLKDNWDLVHLQKAITQKGYQEPKVVYK